MAQVVNISKDLAPMTYADGLAFIERTRRQLDRFALLPRREGQVIRPKDDAEIRRMCDALETHIKNYLSAP